MYNLSWILGKHEVLSLDPKYSCIPVTMLGARIDRQSIWNSEGQANQTQTWGKQGRHRFMKTPGTDSGFHMHTQGHTSTCTHIDTYLYHTPYKNSNRKDSMDHKSKTIYDLALYQKCTWQSRILEPSWFFLLCGHVGLASWRLCGAAYSRAYKEAMMRTLSDWGRTRLNTPHNPLHKFYHL